MGMDTSATPRISPDLEPETMAALMLRYVEDNEEVAHQYARALLNFFTTDLDIPEALQVTRDIATEVTNDIKEFEGEEAASRIDVALRRLIDRARPDWTTEPHRPGRKDTKMSTTIHRTEDATLETIEFGAVYRIRAPRTGEPWTLYKVSDDCGITSIESLEVPDGWDDSYEYAMDDTGIWPHLTRLAMDAYLAHAILEVALVPVVDDDADADSRALLYRFTWPY